MGKVILPGSGGGGLDTDELTALAGDVLKGKLAGVKGSDEPTAGTLEFTGSAADSQVLAGQTYYNTDAKTKRTGAMPNNGAQNAALNCGQSKAIPAGYTPGGTVTANSLASQTGGVTADDSVVRTGKTYWRDGVKRTGTMPVQGADVPGTDRAYATGISCWEGTVCSGVRNGHRLEGVNWIQSNVPNFNAGNIKKGVNVGGLVGTFEGYVPTVNDLYLRGNNPGGFEQQSNVSSAVTTRFEAGQFFLSCTEAFSYGKQFIGLASGSINLAGYSFVNMEFHVKGFVGNGLTAYISMGFSVSSERYNKDENDAYAQMTYNEIRSGNTYTISVNVSAINAHRYIRVHSGGVAMYGYRIWLS